MKRKGVLWYFYFKTKFYTWEVYAEERANVIKLCCKFEISFSLYKIIFIPFSGYNINFCTQYNTQMCPLITSYS